MQPNEQSSPLAVSIGVKALPWELTLIDCHMDAEGWKVQAGSVELLIVPLSPQDFQKWSPAGYCYEPPPAGIVLTHSAKEVHVMIPTTQEAAHAGGLAASPYQIEYVDKPYSAFVLSTPQHRFFMSGDSGDETSGLRSFANLVCLKVAAAERFSLRDFEQSCVGFIEHTQGG